MAVAATGVLSGQTLTQVSAALPSRARWPARAPPTAGGRRQRPARQPRHGRQLPGAGGGDVPGEHGRDRNNHSCLLRNGKAFCWGDDTYGELGNNTTTTTPQSTPVAVYTGGVLSGLTLVQISAGQDWTCALASTGNAYCWGNNSIASAATVSRWETTRAPQAAFPSWCPAGCLHPDQRRRRLRVRADQRRGRLLLGQQPERPAGERRHLGESRARRGDHLRSKLYQLTLTQIRRRQGGQLRVHAGQHGRRLLLGAGHQRPAGQRREHHQ